MRLKGYKPWIPDDWRIIVLIDRRSRQDCLSTEGNTVRGSSARMVRVLGRNPAQPPAGNFQVVNRLAIEELEAWFFGDVEGFAHMLIPRVTRNLERQARYRGSRCNRRTVHHEALMTCVEITTTLSGYPRLSWHENVAQHMEPCRNSSRSFQVFVEGLKACVGESGLRDQ